MPSSPDFNPDADLPDEDGPDDEELVDPLASFMAENITAGSPAGFAPAGVTLEPEPILPATPEFFICLRGPCKHLVEQTFAAALGNARGTFDHRPVATNRYCTRITAHPIDLVDENPLECSEWDPLLPADTLARDAAREDYYSRHPQFRPTVKE